MGNREDKPVRLGVVGQEQAFVGREVPAVFRLQAERSGVDNAAGVPDRVAVPGVPRVDLGVQVEVRQDHVRGGLVGPTVLRLARIREVFTAFVVGDGDQLAFNVLKHLLPGVARRRRPAEGVFFRHDRDSSEEVQPVPVAECPEKSGLGTPLRDSLPDVR